MRNQRFDSFRAQAVARRIGVSEITLFLALTAALLFAFSMPLRAAFSNKSAGTSGAAFLKIGAGARANAMGDAYTSVADDASAIYWNPAGLAGLKKNEFVAMRAQLYQDLEYNFFAFAHPTKSWGTFAVGFNNLNVTGIEQRSGDTDEADSKFSSNDTAYSLAHSMKLSILGLPSAEEEGGLQTGATLKVVRQTLSGNQANSVAGDIGLIYRGTQRPSSLGLTVQNLGSGAKFKNESDPLPLTIRLGSSYRFGQEWRMSGVRGSVEKTGMLVSLDGSFPRDNDPSMRIGTEFTHGWSENLAASARGGYQTGRSRQIEGSTSGIAAGAGITYKSFSFDFSWTPFGDLGNAYRYSARLKF